MVIFEKNTIVPQAGANWHRPRRAAPWASNKAVYDSHESTDSIARVKKKLSSRKALH
jgi:hypothetical protein